MCSCTWQGSGEKLDPFSLRKGMQYLGQDGDHREPNANDEVDGGKELVELALARVLPGVVSNQQGKGCHSCSIPELNSSETIKENNRETICRGVFSYFR